MKRSALIPIAFGFGCGLFAQAVLAGAERERKRVEKVHALERELLEAAAAEYRARAAAASAPTEG